MQLITKNVTYDPCDKVYYIVCPKCGTYVYYDPTHKNSDNKCACGIIWRVKHVGVGQNST